MNDQAMQRPFPHELLQAMRTAEHIVALTGAGVSAESGVPTFRDAQKGIWAQFRPEDLATPAAFAVHPERVWKWYAMRRRHMREVQPNPGHVALAQMERVARKFTLITQNVDRLHHRAGSRRVVELHGCILRVRCPAGHHCIEDYQDVEGDPVPKCPLCQTYMRPDVVWFGEALPMQALEEAVAATAKCDVFLSIGTSTLVYPAAQLPFSALENGATVVEINPTDTPLTGRATYSFQGPSGVILPQLLRAVWMEGAANPNN